MNFLELLTPDGTLIKIANEKRGTPRFFVDNVIFNTNHKNFKVKDLSCSGMQLEGYFEEMILGTLQINNQDVPIEAIKRHSTENCSGYEFKSTPKLTAVLSKFLSPENIAEGLCLYRNKNHDWLCFMDKLENKMFFGFNKDKQTEQFFIKVNQSLIYWTKKTGLCSGKILNCNQELPCDWEIKSDIYLNQGQLEFCRNLVLNNKKITQSFKDWVIEKITIN